jgi:hypothetical protein
MVTPSQMKVSEEILHRRPNGGIVLNLDEYADFGVVAYGAAVEID